MTIFLLVALTCTALPAILFWRNLRVFAPAASAPNTEAADVSILIPARNEEENIEAAVRRALANACTEVVVLDDQSQDRTAAIVRGIDDARVRLLEGQSLPFGWCGKNFAAAQLAGHARGEYFLFVDADVRLAPDAAARLVAEAKARDVQLVSGIPRQITETLFEKMLVPLIHFVLLGFLPIARMRSSRAPAFGTGCGQLLFVSATAYRHSGGHASFADRLHDGLELPRAFRRAGFKTDLCDLTDLADCRMYRSAGEVCRGFTKNAHESLGAPSRILPTTIFLGSAVLPFFLLLQPQKLSLFHFSLAMITAALALWPRLLARARFQQRWISVLLHPVGLTLLLGMQWVGLVRYLTRRSTSWKGRTYSTHPDKAEPPVIPMRTPDPIESAL